MQCRPGGRGARGDRVRAGACGSNRRWALNHGFTYDEIIGPREAGRSLVAHLSARYDHTPESEWVDRIAAGLVRVDGRLIAADAPLARGQRVTWARPPWEEPEAPLAFAVLHEDEHLVAIAKPSGLPTNPGGGFLEHTLLHLVRLRYPGASPVHRLGRGTSGLVLFARTAPASAELSASLRRHEVVKIYRGLVTGAPAENACTLTTPIGPVPRGWGRSLHAASLQGKAATSHVRVLERRDGSSLVEVRIETGRPHQIRIHLAAWGHPLVGDPLYAVGGGFLPGEAVPGDLGYHLHAFKLAIPNPFTGAQMAFRCEPPPVLRSFG
ncbi:MAG: RluA family pseudouridine synthase [Acidobacteria bacterium]|nr:RluA family pseudouridine synthase [Acidobacteriota bacterium]